MRPLQIEVPPDVVHKWQEVVNLIAEIIKVPAAVIMMVEPPNLKVLLASESCGNPYHRNDLTSLNTGQYCEMVMKTRESLLVPDALADEAWAKNPDLKLGMVSYLGLPITWPNNEIFGTICVLDDKRNEYNTLQQRLLLQFRNAVEADLKSLFEIDAQMRRDRAFLKEAQRLSRTGSFSWQVSTGEFFWSEEMYRIFDYTPTSTPSLDLMLARVHPDDETMVRAVIDRATTGEHEFDFEYRLLMPDQSVKHLHVVIRTSLDDSRGRQFIGAVMDVTPAKRAQDRLTAAQAELAHAARVSVIGQLTASIGHEVSQPLGAITASAEAGLRWLGQDPSNLDEARITFQSIINDGRRAGEVVRRIRALARKSETEMICLDINAVVNESASFLRPVMAEQRIALDVRLAARLPTVRGDRVQLQQVVVNLMLNGIQAMTSIHDRPRVLAIQSRQESGSNVIVSVRDSGIGIAQHVTCRLFDPFYTTKPDGMGMGLSICRTIIDAHRGRIWASADEGPGANFHFSLPAEVE